MSAESAFSPVRSTARSLKNKASQVMCETPGRPYLYQLDEATKKALIVRPNCKMWNCPYCAEINRIQWSYKIKHGVDEYIKQGDKFWFVTLTTHRKLRSFEASLTAWRSAWDKLYGRMKRVADGDMHYVLLPELAPVTGRLHAHMIINQSFGAVYSHTDKKGRDRYKCRWIKDKPAECGLGYMNDIRPVTNSGLASWYVSKYVGKTLGVEKWPKDFRRIRPNQHWPEQPEREDLPDGNWKPVMAGDFANVVYNWWNVGYDVVNVQTGELLEFVDLEG